ncbi:hypothetical protein H7Y63_00150 [Polaromonas sp.]|nr:hypothetical protein [Candidatus Saccharibacteria bacterium]
MSERITDTTATSSSEYTRPTINDASKKSKVSTEKRHFKPGRRVVVGCVAAAVAAGGVVGLELLQDRRLTNNAVDSETHGLEKSRLTPQKNLNSYVVLRAGATYTESPVKVDDRLFGTISGNRHVVPEGEVVLMLAPTIATQNGKQIYGAAQKPEGCNVVENSNFVSSRVVAERMNTYAVADQGVRNKLPLVEPFEFADPLTEGPTADAIFNEQGQMRAVEKGKVVACADIMPVSTLNFILVGGGIVPNK